MLILSAVLSFLSLRSLPQVSSFICQGRTCGLKIADNGLSVEVKEADCSISGEENTYTGLITQQRTHTDPVNVCAAFV